MRPAQRHESARFDDLASHDRGGHVGADAPDPGRREIHRADLIPPSIRREHGLLRNLLSVTTTPYQHVSQGHQRGVLAGVETVEGVRVQPVHRPRTREHLASDPLSSSMDLT